MNLHPGLAHLEAGEGMFPSVRDRNELVAELIARQPLPGALPAVHDGGGAHRWKIGFSRAVSASTPPAQDFGINPLTGLPYFSASVFQHATAAIAEKRLWRIFVGMGCINDEPAAIQYLRTGDPRGWTMPRDYPPARKVAKLYGPDYPFVDRPLYETRARPHLLLTAPDKAGQDLGGFELVKDAGRPLFFRTKKMWDREIYRAHVGVTITPFRADPASLNLAAGGAVARRWRVFAGKLPVRVSGSGVNALGSHELARLYLVRTPGKPERDELHVQQRSYWSLHNRSAISQSLLELAGALVEATVAFDLGVIGLGGAGLAVGVTALAIEAALVNLLLADLENIAAETSSLEFWSV